MNEVMELGNKIKAVYDDKTIRVYQAYNDQIGDELVELNTFGPSFSKNRMTWIKPSFLWMMYRSNWGSKENQTRIFAFDIDLNIFKEIVSQAVMSSYHECYQTIDNWKQQLKKTDVVCQWDPEHDYYGNPLEIRSIQLGIKGKTLRRYIEKGIIAITDITTFVHDSKKLVDAYQLNKLEMPNEKILEILY